MGALAVVMRGAFRQLTPPKGEGATRIEQATQKSVDAWLKSTFETYPARKVAAENLVSLFLSVYPCPAAHGAMAVDEAVECDERGGTSEKIAAGRQEGGRGSVQGESACSFSTDGFDVGSIEVIDIEHVLYILDRNFPHLNIYFLEFWVDFVLYRKRYHCSRRSLVLGYSVESGYGIVLFVKRRKTATDRRANILASLRREHSPKLAYPNQPLVHSTSSERLQGAR